jgi:hypothetical protein
MSDHSSPTTKHHIMVMKLTLLSVVLAACLVTALPRKDLNKRSAPGAVSTTEQEAGNLGADIGAIIDSALRRKAEDEAKKDSELEEPAP